MLLKFKPLNARHPRLKPTQSSGKYAPEYNIFVRPQILGKYLLIPENIKLVHMSIFVQIYGTYIHLVIITSTSRLGSIIIIIITAETGLKK